MIPKKIHYCWFGKGEKSELMQSCIASWKRVMPDYEIIEWNESNFTFDNTYAKQAYEARKYAFVSDYARLKIVYEHGGIYLDTDVELVRPLTPLLERGGYLGFENSKQINTGVGFAAPAGHEVVAAMLAAYDDIAFITDGKPDMMPCPRRNTASLVPLGLEVNGKLQTVQGITVYPVDYFCPMDYDTGKINLTENTYSIHRYGYSWADADSIKILERKRKVFKIFPRFCAQWVFNILNVLFWRKRR